MHGVLKGHNFPLKFWVPAEVTSFLSFPFLSQPKISRSLLNWGEEGRMRADTMKCIYFIQLTTTTDFITISVRFFQRLDFNNSNPFSVL